MRCSIYESYRKNKFVKKITSSRTLSTLGPYHHSALEISVTLPYTNGFSRDRALEKAGKIADIQEEYNQEEVSSFTVLNRAQYPVTTALASMNFKIATGLTYGSLHKEVSTFVLKFGLFENICASLRGIWRTNLLGISELSV